MTKSELIERIAVRSRVPRVYVKKVVRAMNEEVREALANEEKVALGDIGTIDVRTMRDRLGRNPKTGEIVMFPAGRKLHFAFSKPMKDYVCGDSFIAETADEEGGENDDV